MHVEAKLVALTQPTINVPSANAEGLISYCARVSNSANQDNEDYKGLLSYCIKNKHWSVFEMANAIVEVQAPRDITRQLLRHRSFSFQEFSQRYSSDIQFTEREFRRQDKKNRQNSVDDLPSDVEDMCQHYTNSIVNSVSFAYDEMIVNNVAKECARVILPEGLTMSRLYVNGTLRSWIHYLEVRDDPGVTQWEHVLMARKIKEALLPAFPTVLGLLDG